MAVTEEEKKLVRSLQESGMTSREILRIIAKRRSGSVETLPVPEAEPRTNRTVETLQDLGETAQGIGREFGRAGEQIVDTLQEPNRNPFEKALQVGAQAFRGGARAFGEAVLGAGKTALPQEAEEAVGRGVTAVAEQVAQSPQIQDLVQRYNQLDPETKRNVDNALGYTEGLAEILTGGAVGRLTKPLRLTEKEAERIITNLPNLPKPPSITQTDIPSFRVFHIAVNPKTKDQAVKALKGAYADSFIENRTAINNKLDRIARGSGVEKEQLITNLAEEGYLPEINGRLADFTQTFDDLAQRKSAVIEAIDPTLQNIDETTSLAALRENARSILENSPQVVENLDQALNELDRFFSSFRTKYGENLTAVQVNDIRKAMNQRTRAFDKEAFTQDTADAVADAMRARLDELVPSGIVREANSEWARLKQIEKTARIFHNQQVDVGVLGRALGSYAGTIAASGLGLSVAGPGGLVVAGLAAHYGGDSLADLLRRLRFNPKLKELIVDDLRSDEQLVKRLKEETSPANKKLLEKELGE